LQAFAVFGARDFDDAELLQVGVDILCVEELETLPPQPRRQVHQHDLAGVRRRREHAFPAEGRAHGHAVDTSHEYAVLPGLDAMRMARGVQGRIQRDDLVVDPGFLAFRAGADHRAESAVKTDLIGAPAQRADQTTGHV
jgi:hypothetical protein